MPGLFSDFDPSFFFRHDHSEKDQRTTDERSMAGEELRNALHLHRVMYRSKDQHGLHIEVLDTKENLNQLHEAMAQLLPGIGSFDGEWSLMQLGRHYVIERTSNLH